MYLVNIIASNDDMISQQIFHSITDAQKCLFDICQSFDCTLLFVNIQDDTGEIFRPVLLFPLTCQEKDILLSFSSDDILEVCIKLKMRSLNAHLPKMQKTEYRNLLYKVEHLSPAKFIQLMGFLKKESRPAG